MTQTIRRAARRHRFVIVDQAAIEDVQLSWAARGLLAYLLSKPDDWKVLVNDLKKRGDLGRDGIYTLLRELRSAGYVRFRRNRDAQGRMRGGTYIVSEVPEPDPAWPDLVEPEAGSPDPAKPEALPNTEINKRMTTTTRQTDTYADTDLKNQSRCLRFPEWVSDEAGVAAQKLVADLDHEGAQAVIDEWVGALAAGAIRTSPLGFLHTLVARYQDGDLGVWYASAEGRPMLS